MTDLTEIRRLNAQLEDLTMSALWNGVPPSYVAAVLLRACYSVVIGAEMDPDHITTELAAIADVIDTYECGHLH